MEQCLREGAKTHVLTVMHLYNKLILFEIILGAKFSKNTNLVIATVEAEEVTEEEITAEAIMAEEIIAKGKTRADVQRWMTWTAWA
ncbi:hypothetical protein POVCU2_0029190 [Plasmodium ovale curtisi]|uniref:Uncharacterized protein n=1 Tax=Plasmodium ovale curtisi TaxID=864141 RepID=A0A1A8WPF6_PLAOA|nr:hypothetical protein POVCU2_0029190 [Plasmodium ovale curtisi]SBS93741.1 hypothetical protein POVCU1_026480 [Plasmodium ovale curtisi]